jgi:hypothetical protein
MWVYRAEDGYDVRTTAWDMKNWGLDSGSPDEEQARRRWGAVSLSLRRLKCITLNFFRCFLLLTSLYTADALRTYTGYLMQISQFETQKGTINAINPLIPSA